MGKKKKKEKRSKDTPRSSPKTAILCNTAGERGEKEKCDAPNIRKKKKEGKGRK